MKKVNWGILGLGEIAQNFAKAFSDAENAKLLASSSKNSDKLRYFEKNFEIEKKFLFNNYDDLISCKDVDIIYIALPNSLHYCWIKKCIENNKNILVEKPATLNFEEIKDINRELDKKKLFFGEAFMYRYHPQIDVALKIIKNEEIGKLISMESNFGINLLTKKKFFFFDKKKKIDPHNRLFNKKLGGGCILDLGCYPSSFSLLVSSLINQTTEQNLQVSNVIKEIGETNVDIHSEAKLSNKNGFYSIIKASFKKNLGNKSEIVGEKGKLIINNTWSGSDSITKITDNNYKSINVENIKNIYSYQIEKISETLLNDIFQPQYPGMSLDETLLNMKIIDEWANV